MTWYPYGVAVKGKTIAAMPRWSYWKVVSQHRTETAANRIVAMFQAAGETAHVICNPIGHSSRIGTNVELVSTYAGIHAL
jgi:hypothetical protein